MDLTELTHYSISQDIFSVFTEFVSFSWVLGKDTELVSPLAARLARMVPKDLLQRYKIKSIM